MAKSLFRSRRSATLLVASATLAVGLVASPAHAAATWESLPVPASYVNMSLLPFDSQNSYATTKAICWGCVATEKLWQRSGSTWKELKPPTDAALNTLAGTAPNDLWAIGRKDLSSGVWHVHHYDGTKWSSDLHPDTNNMEILDAEAVSRTSLWGAGNTRKNGWTPAVTHWDGQRWNTTTFPGIDGGFDAVDVRSENDIWAVGYRSNGAVPATYRPLAMHYDGTKWSEVPVPDAPGNNVLREVFSNGPKDVWIASDNHVWHWDGATWTRRDLPNPGYGPTFANYDGQIYAGTPVFDVSEPKLLRWSGTSWARDTSLTSGVSVSQLASTPDGALYALSHSIMSTTNYLSRLAPPTTG